MERKKYNLRSVKSDDVQTPIQLQLLADLEYHTNLLEVNSSDHSQQASHLNSSNSDLDCSVLLYSSESDDAGTQPRSFDRLELDCPSSSASKPTNFDTPVLSNQTILQQLTAIGERLNKIQQKPVKKT